MSTMPPGPPIVLLPPQPMGSVEMGWTAEQRDALVAAMDAHGDDWDAVATKVEGKSRLEVEIFASEVIRRMGRSLVEAFKLRCMQAPRPLQLGRLYRAEMDARLRDEIAHILTKAEEAMYHDLTSRQPKRRKHNSAQPPAASAAAVNGHVNDTAATAATVRTATAATTSAVPAQAPIPAVPPPRATGVAQSPSPLPPQTASHTFTTSTSATHTDAFDTATATTTDHLDAHSTCGDAQDSPFHGVSWDEERSKWAAHLDHCCLGYYEEEYGAAIAHDIAAREQGPPASDHLNFDDNGNCLVDHPAFPSRASRNSSRAVLSRQPQATDSPRQFNTAPRPPVKENEDPPSKKRRRVAPLHMVVPAAMTPTAAAVAAAAGAGGGEHRGGSDASATSTGGDDLHSGGGCGGRNSASCGSRAGGGTCGIVQASRHAANEGAPNAQFTTEQQLEGTAISASTKRTSIYRGVIWHRASEKWQARIKENKIHKNLGFFVDEKEAALAYDRAARERWGDAAKPNFDGDGHPTHVRQTLQTAREAAPPPATTAFMGRFLSAVEAPSESTEMAMDGMLGRHTRTHTDTPHTDTEESQADGEAQTTHGHTHTQDHPQGDVRVHMDVQWQQQQQHTVGFSQRSHHPQAQGFRLPHTHRPPGSTADPWSDADVVQIVDQLITTTK